MTSLLKTRPVGCCLGQRRPVFAFKAANLVHQRALRLQVLYATPEGQQQQQGPPQQRPGSGAGGGYRQGQGAGGGGSFRPGPGGGGGGSYRPGPGGGSGGSYRPGQGGGTGGPYRSNQGGGGPGGAFRPGPGGGGGAGGAFRTSQGIGVRTVPRPGPGGGAASSDEDSYGGGRRRYGGDRRGGRRGANETLVPINTAIRATEVRVIGEDKEQKGVMSLTVALDMAKDLEVDLVLVVPDASPPVCRLIQYSKYKYELDKADKDKKKAQRESRIDTKELKLRPNTDTHDYEVKVRQAQKFLSKGDRVKVTLQFKGREMEHNQVGKDMFARLVQDLGPEAVVEQPPAFQGRSMNMTLAPKKATVV